MFQRGFIFAGDQVQKAPGVRILVRAIDCGRTLYICSTRVRVHGAEKAWSSLLGHCVLSSVTVKNAMQFPGDLITHCSLCNAASHALLLCMV